MDYIGDPVPKATRHFIMGMAAFAPYPPPLHLVKRSRKSRKRKRRKAKRCAT